MYHKKTTSVYKFQGHRNIRFKITFQFYNKCFIMTQLNDLYLTLDILYINKILILTKSIFQTLFPGNYCIHLNKMF
jgi:hypothetical protein